MVSDLEMIHNQYVSSLESMQCTHRKRVPTSRRQVPGCILDPEGYWRDYTDIRKTLAKTHKSHRFSLLIEENVSIRGWTRILMV